MRVKESSPLSSEKETGPTEQDSTSAHELLNCVPNQDTWPKPCSSVLNRAERTFMAPMTPSKPKKIGQPKKSIESTPLSQRPMMPVTKKIRATPRAKTPRLVRRRKVCGVNWLIVACLNARLRFESIACQIRRLAPVRAAIL